MPKRPFNLVPFALPSVARLGRTALIAKTTDKLKTQCDGRFPPETRTTPPEPSPPPARTTSGELERGPDPEPRSRKQLAVSQNKTQLFFEPHNMSCKVAVLGAAGGTCRLAGCCSVLWGHTRPPVVLRAVSGALQQVLASPCLSFSSRTSKSQTSLCLMSFLSSRVSQWISGETYCSPFHWLRPRQLTTALTLVSFEQPHRNTQQCRWLHQGR